MKIFLRILKVNYDVIKYSISVKACKVQYLFMLDTFSFLALPFVDYPVITIPNG